MKKKITIISLIAAVILLAAPGASAALGNWNVYETDNFVVFYPDGYQYEAVDALYYLEEYNEQTLELTGNDRDFKPYVVLQDIGVASNGHANPYPYKISIFTNNPGTYSRMQGLEDSHSFIRDVSVHEYTHLGQMTNSSGLSRLFCFLFGNRKSSNLYSPGWIIEGITVYHESQLDQYSGRLNTGYFDAVVGSKAKADQLPTIMQATYSAEDYPLGSSYLYGGSFFEYLADEYGEKKLTEYFDEYGSNPWWGALKMTFPGIGIDSAAREVYGQSYPQLFAEWRKHEQKQKQDWQITGEEIAANQGGSLYNLTLQDGKLYYFREETLTPAPYSRAKFLKLMEYDLRSGQKRVLKKLRNRAYGSFQIADGKLYYAAQDYETGFANTDLLGAGMVNTLYQYDLATGATEELFTAEFKDFAVTDEGTIIYAQEDNERFGSKIWQYTDGETKQLGRVDQLISELVPYQEQMLVVSKEKGTSWDINQFNKDLSLVPVLETPAAEKFIRYRAGENKLYFTANYEQKYSIYSYDFASKQVTKLTTSDYANEGIVKDNILYYVGVAAQGEKIYKEQVKPKSYQPLVEVAEDSKEEIKLPSEAEAGSAARKNFSYLLKPYQRYFLLPVAGSDALGLNSYLSTLRWNSTKEGQGLGVDFQFATRMLKPLTIELETPTLTIAGEEDNDSRPRLRVYCPLYNSMAAGMSNITATAGTDFQSISSGLNVNWTYPQQRVSTNLYYSNYFDNDIVGSRASYQYLWKDSSLQLKGDFAATTEGPSVAVNRLGYSHKWQSIRKGLWSPNLFIGDLYGNVYVKPGELGIGDNEGEATTYGYEFLFETGMAFNNLQTITKIGVAVEEGNWQPDPHIRFETNF